MKYLTMQERVDFVNTVVDNATQDGTYLPALLEIYFRIQILIDICGVDISKYQPEQYPELAYGRVYCDNVYMAYKTEDKDDLCCSQIDGLLEACREEAKLRRDYAIGLANYNKKSSADELLDVITSYLKKAEENIGNVDIKQLSGMINKIAKIDKNAVAGEIVKKKGKKVSFEKVKEASGNGGKKQTDQTV